MEESASMDYPFISRIAIESHPQIKGGPISIELGEGEGPKHLIITGPNGSGKTSLLQHLLGSFSAESTEYGAGQVRNGVTFLPNVPKAQFLGYFDAQRVLRMEPVKGPTPIGNDRFFGDFSLTTLSQYLVNRFVSRALAMIRKDADTTQFLDFYFDRVDRSIQNVLGDPQAKLEFVEINWTFRVKTGKGESFEMNSLPSGYSSVFFILFHLLAKEDSWRTHTGEASRSPRGIVLIDEPELHLHIEMQYQVLPLLSTFFPNIQFIVATHSPAVASSLRNAVVYDLGTRQYAPSNAAGMSFTELMETHFGVENEFGPEADKLLRSIKEIYLSDSPPVKKREQIRETLHTHEDIMSSVLRVELESMLIRLEAEASVR